MGLFPRAITCLQFGSDTLKKVLRIIEYYIVLDPVGIMQVINAMDYVNAQQYANEIFTGFVGLGDLKTEANRMMMSVIELIIQGCPLNVFFLTFVQSGFLYKIITAVVIEDVSPTKFSTNEIGELDYHFPILEHPCPNCASKRRAVTSLRSYLRRQS
jgi:hypothetical protein